MAYNKGEIVAAKVTSIVDFGAFVELSDRSSGLVHITEIPARKFHVNEVLNVNDEIEVMILGEKGIDRFGNKKYELSKKKVDEQKIREQVAEDIVNLEGEEKSIREIWKIFTQINKCLLQYMKQPILLDVNTAKLYVSDGKLVVKVNTESKFELFQKSFKQKFNTELVPLTKDSWNFYANIDTLSPMLLKTFEEECECLYMNFFPQPFIEGRIWNYQKNKREEIEAQLEDCFPNIVIISNKMGELSFRQSYDSHSQARDFHSALGDILNEIKNGCTVEDEETGETKEYAPIPFEFEINPLSSLDKFLIERNVFGQQEHELVRLGKEQGEGPHRLADLMEAYKAHWTEQFLQLHANEEELNRQFIGIYGLENELSPDVPLSEVTILQQGEVKVTNEYLLTTEDGSIITDETDAGLTVSGKYYLDWQDDVIAKQLISYAVGCMLGRYRLDKLGLHIAHPEPTAEEIAPYTFNGLQWNIDADGILPLMPSDTDFSDNATVMFKRWLVVAFGEDTLVDNLNCVEAALGKSLDDYFVKDFWKDHKKMYQNRPIYWLFSSKKGAFQCLAYMHRMNAYTAERIRTKYLLPHIEWLVQQQSEMEANAANLNARERKQLDSITRQIAECREYHDRLHTVADEQIAFDLDDGVVVNYAKFGDVLAKLK